MAFCKDIELKSPLTACVGVGCSHVFATEKALLMDY